MIVLSSETLKYALDFQAVCNPLVMHKLASLMDEDSAPSQMEHSHWVVLQEQKISLVSWNSNISQTKLALLYN